LQGGEGRAEKASGGENDPEKKKNHRKKKKKEGGTSIDVELFRGEGERVSKIMKTFAKSSPSERKS